MRNRARPVRMLAWPNGPGPLQDRGDAFLCAVTASACPPAGLLLAPNARAADASDVVDLSGDRARVDYIH